MASATQVTDKKRSQKKARSGKTRKAKNRNQGTTRTAAELFGDE